MCSVTPAWTLFWEMTRRHCFWTPEMILNPKGHVGIAPDDAFQSWIFSRNLSLCMFNYSLIFKSKEDIQSCIWWEIFIVRSLTLDYRQFQTFLRSLSESLEREYSERYEKEKHLRSQIILSQTSLFALCVISLLSRRTVELNDRSYLWFLLFLQERHEYKVSDQHNSAQLPQQCSHISGISQCKKGK